VSGLFEDIQAFDDRHRVAHRKAVAIATKRVSDAVGPFIKNAANAADLKARLSLVEGDIRQIVADVVVEHGGDEDQMVDAVTESLGDGVTDINAELAEAPSAVGHKVQAGGHASDCSCGFCKNKGKGFGDKKKDDDKSGANPDSFEDKGDDDDSDDDSDDSDGTTASLRLATDPRFDEEAAANQQAKYDFKEQQRQGPVPAPGALHQFPDGWGVYQLHTPEDRQQEGESMQNDLGTYNPPEGTDIYSLRDPRGGPHANWTNDPEFGEFGKANGQVKPEYLDRINQFRQRGAHRVAEAPRDGGGAVTTESLPTANDAGDFGGVSGPELDKKEWTGLKPIDTETSGTPHPTETQDISDDPDWEGDFLAQTDAVTEDQTLPSNTTDSQSTEKNVTGQPTKAADQWTGTEGLADPVTARLAAEFPPYAKDEFSVVPMTPEHAEHLQICAPGEYRGDEAYAVVDSTGKPHAAFDQNAEAGRMNEAPVQPYKNIIDRAKPHIYPTAKADPDKNPLREILSGFPSDSTVESAIADFETNQGE
jgi:hypothetical protein